MGGSFGIWNKELLKAELLIHPINLNYSLLGGMLAAT
jgi:uncharacterized membrane protein YiaA